MQKPEEYGIMTTSGNQGKPRIFVAEIAFCRRKLRIGILRIQKGEMNMNQLKKLTAGAVSLAAAAAWSMQAFAESTTNGAGAPANSSDAMKALLIQVGPLVIALILLYLLLMRPQQKREKEAQVMRENVRVGDEICTAGGIVGIVIRVEEETVVMETGAERNKIRIKKWAIHENITQMEEAKKAERAQKAQRQQGITAAPAAADSKKKKKSDD